MGWTAEIEAIEKAIEVEMEDAIEFAKNSPFPDESELYKDNYVQADYPYVMD